MHITTHALDEASLHKLAKHLKQVCTPSPIRTRMGRMLLTKWASEDSAACWRYLGGTPSAHVEP